MFAIGSGRPRGRRLPDWRAVLRRTLFFSGLEGGSGILRPRGNNYPSPTLGCGKILPPQTHLTLSQFESNIREKLSPAEADNIVLAVCPKPVKHPSPSRSTHPSVSR
jgi:hypothetical protein